jgi:hypothetical protein
MNDDFLHRLRVQLRVHHQARRELAGAPRSDPVCAEVSNPASVASARAVGRRGVCRGLARGKDNRVPCVEYPVYGLQQC